MSACTRILVVMSLVKGHSLPGLHSLSSELLFYMRTGRIPEGYRRGSGRVTSPSLSGTRKNNAKRPAYRKDTGRESDRTPFWYGVTFIKSYIII